MHVSITPLQIAWGAKWLTGILGKKLLELVLRSQKQGAAIMGPGDDQGCMPGFQPYGAIAAQTIAQQNGIVFALVGSINQALDLLAQSIHLVMAVLGRLVNGMA